MAQVFGELPEPPQEEEAAHHSLVGKSTREGWPQMFRPRFAAAPSVTGAYLTLAFGILVGESGQRTLLYSAICEY